MDEITRHLISGAIIGAGLAWMIQWIIKFFLFQISNNYLKNTPELSERNIKNFSNWGFNFVFSMFIAFLAVWRELGPYFFNDLLLVTALTIIAQIDLKTMYIEGRTIAFAVIMRLIWIIFFEPREMLFYLSGFFFGAGVLYFVSFFYQTFRNRQGLGEGDAAVLGLIGLWLGWKSIWIVLLISALSGIIISGSYLLITIKKHQDISSILKTKIPFAPFLCFGGLLVYFLKENGFLN